VCETGFPNKKQILLFRFFCEQTKRREQRLEDGRIETNDAKTKNKLTHNTPSRGKAWGGNQASRERRDKEKKMKLEKNKQANRQIQRSTLGPLSLV
jgi:hypothetical protein